MKRPVTGWVILRSDQMPWIGSHDPAASPDPDEHPYWAGWFVYMNQSEAEQALLRLAKRSGGGNFTLEEVMVEGIEDDDEEEAEEVSPEVWVAREEYNASKPEWKEPPPDDLGMMRRK